MQLPPETALPSMLHDYALLLHILNAVATMHAMAAGASAMDSLAFDNSAAFDVEPSTVAA